MSGLLKGGKVELVWSMDSVNWPKDWAKLLMNAVLAAADCLPRGGRLTVEHAKEVSEPAFRIVGTGAVVRLAPESERALLGETSGTLDGRSIQPYLTYKLATSLDAKFSATASPGEVHFEAAKG
jgi:histidine phosphotransferase ChpT